MILSPTVTELAEAYEQEHGHKPSELGLRIAEHIMKVGKMLTELGREDAQQGKSAYTAEVFPALVCKAFGLQQGEDPEIVQGIANIWLDDYMKGRENIEKPLA